MCIINSVQKLSEIKGMTVIYQKEKSVKETHSVRSIIVMFTFYIENQNYHKILISDIYKLKNGRI